MSGYSSARRHRFKFSSVRYRKLLKAMDNQPLQPATAMPLLANLPAAKPAAPKQAVPSSLPSKINNPQSSIINPPLPAPFSFRTYQLEDLARSAIHDGAVIAWDPGLGKTMAIFAWPYLKQSLRTLIVAPASLHDQIIREGATKFHTTVTSIPDQETALSLMRSGKLPLPGHGSRVTGHGSESSPITHYPSTHDTSALPTFFITDYRWLGYNGGDEWPAGHGSTDDFKVTDIIRRRRIAVIARYFGMASDAIGRAQQALNRTGKSCPAHELLGIPADSARSAIKLAYREIARLTHPDLHPEDPTATERMQRLNQAVESMLKGNAHEIVKGLDDEIKDAAPTIQQLMAGIGHVHHYQPSTSSLESSSLASCVSVKCLFAPTLSTLLADCFDCVVADEAVRLKSGITYIASGVLGLRSKYRLALTGTPIKNRLPDIFFLAAWVCGNHAEATARWPFGNTKSHQAAFANNHLVMEENLTKESASKAAGNFRRYVKQTNKITNVHRLWKLLGPVVARRRKDQIGNDIVGKIIHPIHVMPGTAQQAVYKWHIDNPPDCATPVAALGAQLQNLRQAALCPWSSNLQRPGCSGSKSHSKWSPKLIAILNLAATLMEKGEQLVVFSPFQEFSTALKAALQDASVPSLLLDGRVQNTKRGPLAADFKQAKYPVLIAGIDAMGEGHSFECASHLVIPSLSWAYDANRQAIERVHRITSQKDVTIYTLITANSIDERLAAIFGEKGDASDLALDGRLFEEDKKEVSLADLIRSATLDFDPTATTLSEESLAAEWELTLRHRLSAASAIFFKDRRLQPASSKPKSKIQNPKSLTPPSIPTNLIHFPKPRPVLTPERIAQLSASFI